MLYNFSYRDISKDYEHLYCMRIFLLEQEPTVQGVEQMLMELYAQRNIKPEILLMASQDLEDMSRRFVEEQEKRESYSYAYVAHYFVGKDAKDAKDMYPPIYGREIKQVQRPMGTTYIHPLPSLEHRVVMAGFMPVLIG